MDPAFVVVFVVLLALALMVFYALGKNDGYAKAHRELIGTWNRLMQPPEAYRDD